MSHATMNWTIALLERDPNTEYIYCPEGFVIESEEVPGEYIRCEDYDIYYSESAELRKDRLFPLGHVIGVTHTIDIKRKPGGVE